MSYNVSDTLSKDKLSPEPRMIKTIGQVAVGKLTLACFMMDVRNGNLGSMKEWHGGDQPRTDIAPKVRSTLHDQ